MNNTPIPTSPSTMLEELLMNNTPIPVSPSTMLEQSTCKITNNIEFGIMNYALLWDNKSMNCSNEEHKKSLDSIIEQLANQGVENPTICIVTSPEYRIAIAVYDFDKHCYRIAANLVGLSGETATNIMWKKYKILNHANQWQKNKNGSMKSIKGIKAQCVGFADEEAISLISNENKVLEVEKTYIEEIMKNDKTGKNDYRFH